MLRCLLLAILSYNCETSCPGIFTVFYMKRFTFGVQQKKVNEEFYAYLVVRALPFVNIKK